MKNPADDLENRRPVWDAMSEFYLDTELESNGHERIAKVLRASPYSDSELDRIMFGEIYPVLICNLWSAAGEWTAFDLDWLQEAILEWRNRRFKLPTFAMPGKVLIRKPWETVRQMVANSTVSRHTN